MPPSRPLVLAALLVAALLASGCTVAVAGRALATSAVTAGVDPGFIRGSDGGEDDRVAAAALTDLQGFWGGAFGAVADGRGFAPLAGYFSVDSSVPGAPPPCLSATRQIEGNAYYCPSADVMGYDRAALIPVLREEFGDSAAVVVLAHEFGHAVQQRLGVRSGGPGSASSGRAIPTILSEGQADCYAGLFLRQVRDGRTPNLRTDADGVDAAMAALVTFRDPVGTGAEDDDAHGNAFDRVSSFQSGFDGRAGDCAGMSARNRTFTQTGFTSLADASTQGNLPLRELVTTMGPDLDRFFGEVARGQGRQWAPPRLDPAGLPAGLDTAALTGPHDTIGDYASGTLLASRYGLAALGALGRPTTGTDAGRDALCLAGAYTGSVGDSGGDFGLSPGDLDEAVQVLLRSDRAAADDAGASGAGTAYERIRLFRGGVDGGAASCLR